MTQILNILQLPSPLGPLTAVGDDAALFLLQFADQPKLEQDIERLEKKLKRPCSPGDNPSLCAIQKELEQYFRGERKEFKTPLHFLGTAFQNKVWNALKDIPYGKTISYAELSVAIKRPTAYRAAAQANGANPFVIIIPCHRVISSGGGLGGYSSGLSRKRWLIQHEQGQQHR